MQHLKMSLLKKKFKKTTKLNITADFPFEDLYQAL